MTRERAFELLNTYIKNEKLLFHSIATEAVMKALAKHFGEDETKWAMAGLLHDLDAELTQDTFEKHGLVTVEILGKEDIEPEICEAIKRHNEYASKAKRETMFHHALAAGETITGLIYATALVYPDKKIAYVKPKSIIKRMKQKAFAASVDRSIIMECEKMGLTLPVFTEICLNAMKEVGHEIGL